MRFITLLLFMLFISLASVAQVQDTLQYAREKAYAEEFNEANRILELYNKNNTDVYGLWLQGQVAYWVGDYDKAGDLYKSAYFLAPDLPELELDYGRTLFHMGDLKSSEEILQAYLKKDPGNPDAQIMLAYIDHWNGRMKKAKDTAWQVLGLYQEHEMALALREEIRMITAAYVAGAAGSGVDDQPLEVMDYTLKAGKYHSRILSPYINTGFRGFTLPDSKVRSLALEVGNTLSFGMSGPVITLSAGIFKPDYADDLTEFTGHLGISQKLAKHLAIEVSTGRLPYQFTLASLEDPLMQYMSTLALSLNDPESITGRAAYERQTFPDENAIQTAYAYLLKSLIKSGAFRLDLGYSFSYAHSNRNTFRAQEGIMSRPGGNMNNQMSGIYDPYFSPQNQMVNAALGSIRIVPAEAFEIKLRSSYGVFAKADNPVLLSSANPGNSGNLNTYFYEQTYTPVEVFAEVTAKLSKQFHFKAEYQYSKLFFYEFHRFGLSANYSFIKD